MHLRSEASQKNSSRSLMGSMIGRTGEGETSDLRHCSQVISTVFGTGFPSNYRRVAIARAMRVGKLRLTSSSTTRLKSSMKGTSFFI